MTLLTEARGESDNVTKDRTLVGQVPAPRFNLFASTGNFNPSRDERYTGNSSAQEIPMMMSELHETISDYVSQIDTKLKQFRSVWEVLHTPLRGSGEHIDEHRSKSTGKPWYKIEDITIQESETHTPLTAALRAMIRCPEDKPLFWGASAKRCRDLAFSPVLTAFVYWFIIDILHDQFDIMQLPHLKAMNSVLAAVRNLGDESKIIQLFLKRAN